MHPKQIRDTRSMLDLIILVSEQVHSSHRQAESTIGDFKNYVTALEGSFKSVDEDLTNQLRNQQKEKLRLKTKRKKKEPKQ